MFIGREKELAALERRYAGNEFECVVIYGRRRVGKTSLIREFCRDKETVFFSALNASGAENLAVLSKAVMAISGEGLQGASFSSFSDAFDALDFAAKEKRIVFVIDEYPYLAKAEPSISSQLQHIIDHKWQDTKLYLILCGSSMSFMENQVLGYESPIYGRRTAQMKISAMTYLEAAAFHPDLSEEEQAVLYGITGGIPHYINKLGIKDNLENALLENFFSTDAYLFEEPENLLKQELREPATYNSIIAAVAGGASKANEIATKVGLETGVCSKYLRVLIDLGILKKETPITEKAGKKTIYLLADNFFRFWYRFVPRNISAITIGKADIVYERMVKQYIPEYMGLIFEQMCRDYLLRYADTSPIILCDVGQWWGTDPKKRKEVQIDIVGIPIEGDSFIIGSCKYRNEKVDIDELELMKEYAEVFRKNGNYQYYIFSKSGFTKKLISAAKKENVKLVTLSDMYKGCNL